jgi:hypothetical protein
MRPLLLVLVLVVAVLPAAARVHAQPVQYGKWEVTTKVDMPGLPMDMPPVTHTQCLTEDDMTPHTPETQENCETDFEVDGNTVHYTVTCEQPEGTMRGEGSSTYTDDTMMGSMRMVMQSDEGTMEMTHEYSGRYIGPCE